MRHLSRMSYRIIMLTVVSIALLALAGGCSQPAPLPTNPPGAPTTVPLAPTLAPPPPAVEVRISNFAFQPAQVTIKPNQTVGWINNDNTAHTVTGSGFDSGSIGPGGRYDHLFDTVGTYNYSCTIHPQMQGSVIVQE